MNQDATVQNRCAAARVLAAGLLLMVAGCASTQPAERRLSADEQARNVASFDDVWTTVRDKHWDATLGGLDWQAVRDELRGQVERAATMPEARSLMQAALARLHQSHFAILPADLYDDLDDAESKGAESASGSPARVRDGDIGFDVRVIDGAALVTKTRPSPAFDAGVRAGWEIVAVAGREMAPVLQRVAERTQDARWLEYNQSAAVISRLLRAPGDSVEATFRDGDGAARKLTVAAVKRDGTKAKLGFLPGMWVELSSRRLPSNVGYFHLSSFFDPQEIMRRFGEAMDAFAATDGVIIDLRGNPGGIGVMACGMAGYFVAETGRQLGTMSTRDAALNFVVFPRARVFDGPLAILVDGFSMSTSEIMAGGLKDIGRVRIFGTPTPGAALPSQIVRLPNGDGFQFAFANYVSASGAVLEGAGVVPDERAPPQRDVLLAGGDPAIDAAVRWILEQKRGAAAAAR